MPNLYTIAAGRSNTETSLVNGEISSIVYHDIFDYPLTFSELIRWQGSDRLFSKDATVISKNGYFYIEGKEGLIYKRLLRKRISIKKMEIAQKASTILSLIPQIRMIAVTGSLAMENSDDGSDIDLLIVTKKRSLWTARLFAYLLIGLFGIQTRRPFERNQKDKLCLNMWLDESNLAWNANDKNAYTAHEIAQILPLVNKDGTYERFLYANKWILDFWPNSVRIRKHESGIRVNPKNPLLIIPSSLFDLMEKVAFSFQYAYMKSKITRELVTPTRAIFHPQDWGSVVLDRVKSFS